MPNIETTMASSTTKTEKPKLILPWKTKLAMSIASALTDAATHSDGTINRRLLNFLDRRIPPKPAPINGVYTRDVSVDAANNVWFRVYTPTAATSATATVSLPVIIFFHGGGFAFLSPASPNYDAVCRRFCRKIQVVVVSVNYRLCPEHRYPTQYDDGFSAVKFIDENRASLPEIADVSKCFIAGDSAGANIAHHVAIRVCQSELQQLQVIGLISIQPYFGGEERTESELRLTNAPLVSVARTDWLWKVLLPDGSDRDHPASNVSGPNAIDLSGIDYPDTLVFVGGFDPLQDWQRRYYEWLKKSGKKAEIIEYPNMIHAFYVFPNLPEATQLISQVKDFIMKRVSN